jgi:hypothetical protein
VSLVALSESIWDSEAFWFNATITAGILFAVSTLIVVIGLVGEARKSSQEWLSWHATFEILVIIGVVGELFTDGTLVVASARIDAISYREVEAAKAGALTAQKVADIAKTTADQEIERDKNTALVAVAAWNLAQPRTIDFQILRAHFAGKPNTPVEILYAKAAPDGPFFADWIGGALSTLGWPHITPKLVGIPASVGGQPIGVTLVRHEQSEHDSTAGSLESALTLALGATGQISLGVSGSVPKGALRIVIGPKP